jgi:hypothetical protein
VAPRISVSILCFVDSARLSTAANRLTSILEALRHKCQLFVKTPDLSKTIKVLFKKLQLHSVRLYESFAKLPAVLCSRRLGYKTDRPLPMATAMGRVAIAFFSFAGASHITAASFAKDSYE